MSKKYIDLADLFIKERNCSIARKFQELLRLLWISKLTWGHKEDGAGFILLSLLSNCFEGRNTCRSCWLCRKHQENFRISDSNLFEKASIRFCECSENARKIFNVQTQTMPFFITCVKGELIALVQTR